tara:strand:+ start:349 stop:618 length:270 start_codon:yes stop_codon:yes gene_type:complete
MKWRRTKYQCNHVQTDDETKSCGLGKCEGDDLFECCANCTHYEGRDRGLGDTIKRATTAVGIKPCGGCQKRREQLNKMTSRFYDKKEKE